VAEVTSGQKVRKINALTKGERGKRKWKMESVVKREKEGRERKEVAEGQVMQHFTSRTFYLSESGMVKTCGSRVNGEKEQENRRGWGLIGL
jgi:hypothetical protein